MKIGNKKFINENLNNNNLYAKKKFGQNFLTDQNILNSIVDVSNLTKDDLVIEIGPGLGSLTELLCEKAGFVLAYEIDTDLIPVLKQNLNEYNNFEIINKDILEVDINTDIDKYKKNYNNIYLVSNLPYYITTPIITKIITDNIDISKIVVMVQKEVGERFTTLPGSREYSSITVLLNYFYDKPNCYCVNQMTMSKH